MCIPRQIHILQIHNKTTCYYCCLWQSTNAHLSQVGLCCSDNWAIETDNTIKMKSRKIRCYLSATSMIRYSYERRLTQNVDPQNCSKWSVAIFQQTQCSRKSYLTFSVLFFVVLFKIIQQFQFHRLLTFLLVGNCDKLKSKPIVINSSSGSSTRISIRSRQFNPFDSIN